MFSRAMGRTVEGNGGARGASLPRLVVSGAALLVFACFGTFVAMAGDDAGVHEFIRRETRGFAISGAAARLPSLFTLPARPGRIALGYAPSGDHAAARFDRRRQQNDAFTDRAVVIHSGDVRQRGLARASAAADRVGHKTAELGTESPVNHPTSRQGVAYCVRLCDGYFFPLSRPGASAAELQASCSNLCPSSKTRLYSAPAGSVGIEQARFRGEPYTSLPTAFLHRSTISKACTCTAVGYGLETQDARSDATFRRGDVLVLEDRLKVYSGQETGRNRSSDFRPIETSTLLTRTERRQLSALAPLPASKEQQKTLVSATAIAPDPALRLTPLETQGKARFEPIAPQETVRIVRQEIFGPDPAQQHP